MVRNRYIDELRRKLSGLDMPIYFETQDETTQEPYILIGVATSDSNPTAKTNRVILNDIQQINIYVSARIGRVEAENTLSKAVSLLGRNMNVSTQIMKDNSIGREVYQLVIRVQNYIF